MAPMSEEPDPRLRVVVDLAARQPGLRLLVLFGSRARGEATERSDWDLGYLADASFDPDRLLGDLLLGLGTDDVDLVDLAGAGALVRYRAARDGRLLYETPAGVFMRFSLEAVRFWCDVEPVLRHAYRELLTELQR